MKVNIGGRVSDKREPLTYSLWQNIMWCTPFASPGFVDGKYIYNYKNNYIPLTELTSGLDCYYNWGYRKTTQNELNLDLALSQNLDVITKGLTLNVKERTILPTIWRPNARRPVRTVPIRRFIWGRSPNPEWMFQTRGSTIRSSTRPTA